MRALFGPTVVFVLGGPGAGKGAHMGSRENGVGTGPFWGVALGVFFLGDCKRLALYIQLDVIN